MTREKEKVSVKSGAAFKQMSGFFYVIKGKISAETFGTTGKREFSSAEVLLHIKKGPYFAFLLFIYGSYVAGAHKCGQQFPAERDDFVKHNASSSFRSKMWNLAN